MKNYGNNTSYCGNKYCLTLIRALLTQANDLIKAQLGPSLSKCINWSLNPMNAVIYIWGFSNECDYVLYEVFLLTIQDIGIHTILTPLLCWRTKSKILKLGFQIQKLDDFSELCIENRALRTVVARNYGYTFLMANR